MQPTDFYVAWSTKQGESTYTRWFPTEYQRDKFAHDIKPISSVVHTWEKEIPTKVMYYRYSYNGNYKLLDYYPQSTHDYNEFMDMVERNPDTYEILQVE